MSPSTKTIDHLVHLTPPGSLEETSKQFRELGFNVVPGGKHAGGLTENALVVFEDGAYLELISFTSPSASQTPDHPWANKPPGWIDYAFLGTGSDSPSTRISDIINARGDGLVVYLPEEKGGRKRPDGKVLEWLATAPEKIYGRGVLPFFCGDISPREWRVPEDPPENRVHPSTTRGIAHVRLLTTPENLVKVSKQLTSVVGSEPAVGEPNKFVWILDTPSPSPSSARLILDIPTDADEESFVKGDDRGINGIYEVAFWVDKGRDQGSAKTPFGKILWVPLV